MSAVQGPITTNTLENDGTGGAGRGEKGGREGGEGGKGGHGGSGGNEGGAGGLVTKHSSQPNAVTVVSDLQ